jgi:peptidoglycan hydrolase FlgJ
MLKLCLVSILILFFLEANALTKSEARLVEIEKAAVEYEAVMVKQVLSQIYENIPVNSLVGGGEAEKTFRDLLLTEYAREIAKSGTIGVAKNLVADIKKTDSLYNKLLGGEDDKITK